MRAGFADRGPDWVRDAVFYQIFPDRFASSLRVSKPGVLEPWDSPPTTLGFKGGDLLGIAEHLDDLRELGITALYLTPIFASASNHRYHTFDYELVDPLLGGDAALRELLDAAHGRGMRVILDGVFNHASRGFWPFHHVLENGAASPYRDWFYLDADVLAGRSGLNAYPGPVAPPAAPGSGSAPAAFQPDPAPHLGYQAWWDLPALPKLNHSNPAVREYIFGVAQRWLRVGIDGWRLDVPEEIGEMGFWEEFRRRCLDVNPEVYLVGEIWNPAPDWLAGGRFHGLMNYPLTESILSFVGAGRLDEPLVAKTNEFSRHVRPIDGPEFGRQLERLMSTYEPAVAQLQLNLLDSHDTPRFVSLAGGDATAMRLATLIQMTLPGAPCIYYGDEVGLEGREDPDCRRGFPWDPTRQDRSMRDFMTGMIAIRAAYPVLRRGRFELLAARDSAVAYRMFEPGIGVDRAGEPSALTSTSSSTQGPGAAGLSGGAGSAFGAGLSGGGRSIGRSIVVAINAGDGPIRLDIDLPGLASGTANKVSWSGRELGITFAPGSLERGTLAVDLQAREGAAFEVVPPF